jgi:hypothetical protein
MTFRLRLEGFDKEVPIGSPEGNLSIKEFLENMCRGYFSNNFPKGSEVAALNGKPVAECTVADMKEVNVITVRNTLKTGKLNCSKFCLIFSSNFIFPGSSGIFERFSCYQCIFYGYGAIHQSYSICP